MDLLQRSLFRAFSFIRVHVSDHTSIGLQVSFRGQRVLILASIDGLADLLV